MAFAGLRPLQDSGEGHSPTKGSRDQRSAALGSDGSGETKMPHSLRAAPRYHFWQRNDNKRRPKTAPRQSAFALSVTFAISFSAPAERSR